MNRRHMLLLAGGALLGAGGLGLGGVLRLHRSPNRYPDLTEAHLASLAAAELPRPRALFIGNSLILNHDVAGRVAAQAAKDGIDLAVATAGARGARLVETMRVSGFAAILRKGWDAVIVQDFSATPFRAIDRWGSVWAVARIARLAAPAPLLLCPPFPAARGSRIYEDAGFLARPPASPREHVARTMAHYRALGHPVAPVPERWIEIVETGTPLHAADGHHANPDGAALVAQVVWPGLRPLLGL